MTQPPSPLRTLGEAFAGREVARLALRYPSLTRLGASPGRTVVLTPGLGASDASMAPLRRYLGELGHRAQPAGLGRISPDVAALFPRLVEVAENAAARGGEPVVLVGWSLGGILSREVARERPDLVRRVITFGSPVEGGPAYSIFARRYSADQRAEIARRIALRRERPITVPVTAMWSKRDGVVAPQACIDQHTPGVENIEVSSTHLGMGLDPDVWRIVATRLQR